MSLLTNLLKKYAPSYLGRLVRVFENPYNAFRLFRPAVAEYPETLGTIPQTTIIPRKILYGEMRIPLDLIYARAVAYAPLRIYSHLYAVWALAGHKVDNINQIYVDGEAVEFDRYSRPPRDSRFYTSGGDYVLLANKHRRGGFGIPGSWFLLKYQPEWNAQNAFTKIACVATIFTNYSDILTKVPEISVEARGKRVYDPRPDEDSEARGVQRRDPRFGEDDGNSWSSNPALCLNDYLVYGLKLSQEDIDEDYLISAANCCDEEITFKGETRKRYACHAYFSTEEKPQQVIESLLATMAGTLTVHNGKWRIHAGRSEDADYSLSEKDIIGPVSVVDDSSYLTRMNRVSANYTDALRGANRIRAARELNDLELYRQDGEKILEKHLWLRFTGSENHAQHLMKIALAESRNLLLVTLRTKFFANLLPIWSCINLTLPDFGWQEKKFRLVKRSSFFDGTTEVVLKEENDQVWSQFSTNLGKK